MIKERSEELIEPSQECFDMVENRLFEAVCGDGFQDELFRIIASAKATGMEFTFDDMEIIFQCVRERLERQDLIDSGKRPRLGNKPPISSRDRIGY